MSLLDDAKALWHHIVSTVTADQAVQVITAVTTGIHETAQGKAANVLASVQARDPKAFAMVEDAAKAVAAFLGGPLAAGGVAIAFDLLAMSHGMTEDEQKVWMDRQNAEV